MRRNVDVPKHSKKRERASKIDPISINMYEVFADGRGRPETGGCVGYRDGKRGFVLFLPFPSPLATAFLDSGVRTIAKRSRRDRRNCSQDLEREREDERILRDLPRVEANFANSI